MGLADRDYNRDPAAASRTAARGGAARMTMGRIRSLSPRGGPSASFVLIVLCSAIFILDAFLPQVMVQSSPWVVSPVLSESVRSIEGRIAQLEEMAKIASSRNDPAASASMLEERASLQVVLEQRLRLLDEAERRTLVSLLAKLIRGVEAPEAEGPSAPGVTSAPVAAAVSLPSSVP